MTSKTCIAVGILFIIIGATELEIHMGVMLPSMDIQRCKKTLNTGGLNVTEQTVLRF